jgi:hypothetical protein
MERWGVPVPRSDDEEKTELALSFDDAEFQQDPASVGSNGSSSAASAADSADRADKADSASDAGDGASGAAEHLSA